MTTLPQGPVRLRKFFEEIYCPLQLRGRSPDYVEIFRGAIIWFRRSLGREPTLQDLNRGAVQDVLGYVVESGRGRLRVKDIRKRIVALWRYAHAVGLVAEFDPPALPQIQPPAPAWATEEPQPGTLLYFYRQTYRPGHVAGAGAGKRTIFDSAVNYLHTMAGRLVLLDEVDEALVNRLRAWLQASGIREPEAIKRANALRSIVRASRPDRLPLTARNQLRGELPPPEPGTLRHLFETAYRPQQLLDCTDVHRADCRRKLAMLRTLYGRDILVTELTDALLAEFLQKLLAQGRQPSTVNSYRAHLVALWRFAHERGLLSTLPRVKKLKAHLEEPDAWSEGEAARILDAASRFDRPPIAGIPAGKFWRALLLVDWWTAIRRKSLLGIRREDVDLASGWLYVPARRSKNRRGKRFRLGPDALDAIRDIWSPERELLFPWPAALKDISLQFNQILQRAGIPRSKRRNLSQFHKWRRTVATTAAARAGLPAAIALLDHSGPEVTKRYIDPSKLPGNDATAFLPILAAAGR
jgi:integrase